MSHYNPENELTLQIDASSFGPVATLLQQGEPIAFAFRNSNQKELSQPLGIHDCPGQVVASDLFSLNGRDYLVSSRSKLFQSFL